MSILFSCMMHGTGHHRQMQLSDCQWCSKFNQKSGRKFCTETGGWGSAGQEDLVKYPLQCKSLADALQPIICKWMSSLAKKREIFIENCQANIFVHDELRIQFAKFSLEKGKR